MDDRAIGDRERDLNRDFFADLRERVRSEKSRLGHGRRQVQQSLLAVLAGEFHFESLRDIGAEAIARLVGDVDLDRVDADLDRFALDEGRGLADEDFAAGAAGAEAGKAGYRCGNRPGEVGRPGGKHRGDGDRSVAFAQRLGMLLAEQGDGLPRIRQQLHLAVACAEIFDPRLVGRLIEGRVGVDLDVAVELERLAEFLALCAAAVGRRLRA